MRAVVSETWLLPADTADLRHRRRSVAESPGESALRGGVCRLAQLRKCVGHLERAVHGFRALVDPRLRLLDVLDREDAEADRHARLERCELEPARGLACDVVEVRGLAADDAAECDDAGVAAR